MAINTENDAVPVIVEWKHGMYWTEVEVVTGGSCLNWMQAGFKVKHSCFPISAWQFSKRSSMLTNSRVVFYLMKTVDQAVRVMRSLNGAGLVFTESVYSSPFPMGTVWINFDFKGELKAHAADAWKRSCMEAQGATHDVGGYIGNSYYQDGSKFSSCSPVVLAISRAWLAPITTRLNACTRFSLSTGK